MCWWKNSDCLVDVVFFFFYVSKEQYHNMKNSVTCKRPVFIIVKDKSICIDRKSVYLKSIK